MNTPLAVSLHLGSISSGRPGSVSPLAAKTTPTPETKGGTKEGEGQGGAFRQLVGLKGTYTFFGVSFFFPYVVDPASQRFLINRGSCVPEEPLCCYNS